jgi:hypothetical protein
MHAFVVLTADNRANRFVFPRFRSRQQELLRPRFEEKIPTLHLAAILGPQQREAMNRSIAA